MELGRVGLEIEREARLVDLDPLGAGAREAAEDLLVDGEEIGKERERLEAGVTRLAWLRRPIRIGFAMTF